MLFDKIKKLVIVNEANSPDDPDKLKWAVDTAQGLCDSYLDVDATAKAGLKSMPWPGEVDNVTLFKQYDSLLDYYKKIYNSAPNAMLADIPMQQPLARFKSQVLTRLSALYLSMAGADGTPVDETRPVYKAIADMDSTDAGIKASAAVALNKYASMCNTVLKKASDLKGDTFTGKMKDGKLEIGHFDVKDKFGKLLSDITAKTKVQPNSAAGTKNDIVNVVFNFGHSKYDNETGLNLAFASTVKSIEDSALPAQEKEMLKAAATAFNLKHLEALAKAGKADKDGEEPKGPPTPAEEPKQETTGAIESQGGIEEYVLTGLEISILKIGVTTFMRNFHDLLTKKGKAQTEEPKGGYGLAGMMRNAKMLVSDLVGYDMQSSTAAVINSYASTRKTLSNAMKKGVGASFGIVGALGGWDNMRKMYGWGENLAGVPLKEFMESNPEDLNTHMADMENSIRQKLGLPALDVSSDPYLKYQNRYGMGTKYSNSIKVIDRSKVAKAAQTPSVTAAKVTTPTKPATKPAAPAPTHAAQTASTPKKVNASLEYEGGKLFEEGEAPGSIFNTPAQIAMPDSMTAPGRGHEVEQTGMFNQKVDDKAKKKKKKMNSSIENFMGFDEFVNEYYDVTQPTASDNEISEGEILDKIKKVVGDLFAGLFKKDYNSGDTGMNSLIANQALSSTLAKGDAGIVNPSELQSQADIQKVLDGLWKKSGGGRYMNELINILKTQIQDQISKKSTELTATKDAARKKAAEKAITAHLKILKDAATKEGDTGIAYQIAARKADAEDFVAKADAILTKWLITNKVVTKLAEPVENIDKGVAVVDQERTAANDPNTIKAKVEATKKGQPVDAKTLNDAYGEELAKQTTVNDKAAAPKPAAEAPAPTPAAVPTTESKKAKGELFKSAKNVKTGKSE